MVKLYRYHVQYSIRKGGGKLVDKKDQIPLYKTSKSDIIQTSREKHVHQI